MPKMLENFSRTVHKMQHNKIIFMSTSAINFILGVFYKIPLLVYSKNFYIILFAFILDRIVKVYLLHIQDSGVNVDFYIYDFLNFYLVWNTGIAFGLAALEANIYYNILTAIIAIVIAILIIFLFKSKSSESYLLALVIGGSLGNLFDRIYYHAVPDFIDFHIGEYHWFVFNIADIFITIGIIGLIVIEIFKKK